MQVRLLADHFGPDIHETAGTVLDMDDAAARASIEAGYAEAVLVPLEAAAVRKPRPKPAPKPKPVRATPAAARETAVKGPDEA